ncbi:hypothetical protein [Paenibacillus sp. KS-LC4]|uniref:hypothetical protein n=1 Tax=Paenibacillus sp. KS-LC4 TaxID=2979727 RepID=UPI0030CE065A
MDIPLAGYLSGAVCQSVSPTVRAGSSSGTDRLPAIEVSSTEGKPEDTLVDVGTTATFSVIASGSGLTYQWQVDTTGTGNGFKDVSGATSSSRLQ